MNVTPERAERFASKVDRTGDCHEWLGCHTPNGYGKFSVGPHGAQLHLGAHRFAYEMEYGPIPPGRFVCHRCDNPGCVNPAHLFLGTPADNTADMMRKNRQKVGEAHPSARLTAAQVAEIRRLRAEGLSWDKLAKKFDISARQAWRIAKGLSWRQTMEVAP